MEARTSPKIQGNPCKSVALLGYHSSSKVKSFSPSFTSAERSGAAGLEYFTGMGDFQLGDWGGGGGPTICAFLLAGPIGCTGIGFTYIIVTRCTPNTAPS